MSIQEHLNKIRNAIYGREVRESIAKGIETAYDDASENGNANMEVKIARGTHPNLRSRLEEVDNKQQETTEKIDANHEEVTAQLAQTDSKKVDKDGSQQVKWANIAQDAREQISGEKVSIVGRDSVGPENIIKNSVSIDHLNNSLKDYLRKLEGIIEIRFELGGWKVDGEKITKTSPINLRSSNGLYLDEGMKITQKNSDIYEYELFERRSLAVGDEYFIRRTGYIPFGTTFEINNGNFYYIMVRRTDGERMTNDDVEEVQSLFNNIPIPKEPSDFDTVILNKISELEESSKTFSNVTKFNFSGKIENVMTEDIQDFFTTLPTPQEFHDDTIEVIQRHTDIASYELLGQESYGYNMYKYEIKPHIMKDSPEWNITPTDDIGEPLEIPKIIITSGIHGSERNANFVVHYLIKNLLDNPNNIETFDTLAQNIHWVFVPMCNPSGYVDDTYHNRNGVNLNRDFPPYGDVTQLETELIKAVFDQHSDADYHIDYHNFTPQEGKFDILGYALTDNPELKRLTTNAYRYVGRQWQLKDSRFPQSRTHQWGYTADANGGTAGKYTNSQLGIPSSIVETPKWQLFFDEEKNGKTVTQQGVDVISNVLINIFKARR